MPALRTSHLAVLLPVLLVAPPAGAALVTTPDASPQRAIAHAADAGAVRLALFHKADEGGKLEVELSEWSLGFKTKSVEDGTLTIQVKNTGANPHSLRIESAGGGTVAETEIFDPGGSRTLDVDLGDGAYTLYCYVEGHRAAGMEATLTIGGAAEKKKEPATGGGGYY